MCSVADPILAKPINVRLRPSFLRHTAWVVGAMLVVSVIAYFQEGYRDNRWWTGGYMLSFLIPFSIFPVVIWLMSVPSHLEFSDRQITIKRPFRRPYTLSWVDLQSYGFDLYSFRLEFVSIGTFEIFSQGFRPADLRLLKNFLSATFPDKKALPIGKRMFKWLRQKI